MSTGLLGQPKGDPTAPLAGTRGARQQADRLWYQRAEWIIVGAATIFAGIRILCGVVGWW